MLHLSSSESDNGLSNETTILTDEDYNKESNNSNELEQEAYKDHELGRFIILNECVESAIKEFYMNISCTPQPDALNPCEDIVR